VLVSAAAVYVLTVLALSVAQGAATLSTHANIEQADIQVAGAQFGDLDAAPDNQAASASGLAEADTQTDVTAGAAAASDAAEAAPATTGASETAAATDATDHDLAIAGVAPTETHLPAWVQVAVASGSLYAADSASDQVAAKLPRYTYLRVINGGSSRLQVQVYDDGGNPGLNGWVSAEQVLPSAPGTNWLVAASTTTLWSAADASGTAVRDVAKFAPLQQQAGPELNRIQVSVYRSDFSSIVGSGWVDVSATGPALAPQTRVPGPTDRALANRVPTSADQQTAFLNAAASAARQGQAQTGVPASVTVAQAILESDWGRSTLAQDANNYFGMKVMGTLGNDGLVWMPTSEYDASGHLYQTTSAFRAYKSLADSTADHDRLLGTASRYSSAMQSTGDPREFAALIAQDGYSTDPAYADKLVALMDRYGLYQLDA
jgi:flagellum-specific peptidoglycan hydrolase FlgJ